MSKRKSTYTENAFQDATCSNLDTSLVVDPIKGEEQIWQTVAPAKKIKKLKASQRLPRESEKGSFCPLPKANVKKVSLDDFRDLAFYVLSDKTQREPPWLKVQNATFIRRVVVLLVPGLCPDLFKFIMSRSHHDDRNPHLLSELNTPEELKFFAQTFKYLWPCRSTGDSWRVHSPINAILQTPLSEKQKTERKQSRPTDQKVDVSYYLATVEQMMEHKYPLHPSCSENVPGLDAGYVATKEVIDESLPRKEVKRVIALDCEMVQTKEGSELARVTLVGQNNEVILDKLVLPASPVVDYVTRWSGITAEILNNVTTTLADVQADLLGIIDDDTILLGHSLENDLHALKLAHPHIIDTSFPNVYSHPRGPPYKPSLKWLSEKYLKNKIQQSSEGHDSAIDAITCMNLLLLKMDKGPDFGTFKVDFESTFHHLNQAKVSRTSAVVDYGAPSRMHGATATKAVSCQNDDEIIEAVNGVVQECDFTWARLRDLEIATGWGGSSREESTLDRVEEPSQEAILQALLNLDARLETLHEGLPECTALMIYSGTGDPREMSRLQSRQRRHKEEFKTTKWDQLSIQWTDADQQGLRAAVEKAKQGVAFLAVK